MRGDHPDPEPYGGLPGPMGKSWVLGGLLLRGLLSISRRHWCRFYRDCPPLWNVAKGRFSTTSVGLCLFGFAQELRLPSFKRRVLDLMKVGSEVNDLQLHIATQSRHFPHPHLNARPLRSCWPSPTTPTQTQPSPWRRQPKQSPQTHLKP